MGVKQGTIKPPYVTYGNKKEKEKEKQQDGIKKEVKLKLKLYYQKVFYIHKAYFMLIPDKGSNPYKIQVALTLEPY